MLCIQTKYFSSTVFEKEDESHDDDPVDEADLGCLHPHIVLHVHNLLKLFVSFLDLAARVLYVEVYSVEHASLLDHKV